MNYHLVGIGGVGMSALAQLLLALGHRVSGSDRYYDQGRELNILKKLQLLGVKLSAQDGRAVQNDLDAVVVSTAIEEDNPDMAAARAKKIKILHRAELLAFLAKDKKCIAVTGTAGKTTVTGMIGFCLEQAGFDPTVITGGAVLNWVDEKRPGNFRLGRSDTWVMELDESDRSLLRFAPDWAVVTNVSQDHFKLDEVKSLFATFAKQVKNGIIGCDPLKNFEKVGREHPAPPNHGRNGGAGTHAPYLSEQNKAVLKLSGAHASGSNFIEVTERGVSFRYRNVDFRLPLLGRHNIENALNCVMLCGKMGMDLKAASKALEKFNGIERRLEIVGRTGRITVIDDYAHNPAKIAAALDAVRPFSKRVVAVWRPHGYVPLRLMYQDLIAAFSKCIRTGDYLVIMSVYFAGGTTDKKVTAKMLADDLMRHGLPAGYAENYEELSSALRENIQAGDTLLLMGARDPDLPVFARSIIREYENEQK